MVPVGVSGERERGREGGGEDGSVENSERSKAKVQVFDCEDLWRRRVSDKKAGRYRKIRMPERYKCAYVAPVTRRETQRHKRGLSNSPHSQSSSQEVWSEAQRN